MIFGSYLYWIATDLKLVQVEITDSNVYPQSFNCTLVHMWKKRKYPEKRKQLWEHLQYSIQMKKSYAIKKKL